VTSTDINISLFGVVWTLACVLVGFWMGRKTQRPDHAVKDIIDAIMPEDKTPYVDEDPFHEPMTGEKQKRIQIIEGE